MYTPIRERDYNLLSTAYVCYVKVKDLNLTDFNNSITLRKKTHFFANVSAVFYCSVVTRFIFYVNIHTISI